jgi:hypothetical protein
MRILLVILFLTLSVTVISNVPSPEVEEYLEQYNYLPQDDYYYQSHCCG